MFSNIFSFSSLFSRAQKTPLSQWWWTIDKTLLSSLFLLIAIGFFTSLAASPPVAHRLGLESFHFVNKHIFFSSIAICVLLATSFLSVVSVRRAAFGVFVLALFLVVITLLFGQEVKGSTRWIDIFGFFQLQPSELLKPGFVVFTAWLMTQTHLRPDMPAFPLSVVSLFLVAGLLLMQPDFGQTMLIVGVWLGMLFLAGLRWRWIVFAILGVASAGFIAYHSLNHVQQRIDSFLNPEAHDTYQIDRATESFLSGGWFGTGPGEGHIKQHLPDSHTDFVFAVIGEEFGILFCLFLIGFIGFILWRGLMLARNASDEFAQLAAGGLMLQYGLQSFFNIGVNLQLLPAKGMTLPMISYGGTSLIASALAFGFVLALTRQSAHYRAMKDEAEHDGELVYG